MSRYDIFLAVVYNLVFYDTACMCYNNYYVIVIIDAECPPYCTATFCTAKETRTALCTLYVQGRKC